MDKHKAHDVVHQWNGGKTENCPKCNGEMTNDEMMSAATEIASANFKPTVNPMTPYTNRMQVQYAEEKAKKDAEAKEKEKKLAEEKQNKEDFSIRPLIDLLSFAESGSSVPSTIKLIPVGKYKMQRYGDVDLTADKLAEMVKHFNDGIRAGGKDAGLPIDIEHGSTQYKDAAAGWIKDMTLKADGVYGAVDWTSLGKKLLKEKIYKFYSPEFHFKYVDPQHSFEMNNVMTGGGLVNKPMIKDDLPAIVNAENDTEKYLTKDESTNTIYLELINNASKTMKLSEIVAKEKTTRSSEEQKFLVDHKEELTLAEARKEGLLPEPTDDTEKKVVLAEGQVAVSEEKLNSLIKMAEAGNTANEKLKKAELTEEVKKIVFSEEGTKVATDQVEVIVDLAFSMSEDNRKKYFDSLRALPTAKLMSEKGTTKEVASGSAAGGDLDKKAKELATSEKITYQEAIKRVVKENPQQYKEYNENLPVAQQER